MNSVEKPNERSRVRAMRRSMDANENFLTDCKDGWVDEAIAHVEKEKEAINNTNSAGLTPLLLALSGDHHVDFVRALLERGADANIRDRSGCSPLHRSCQTNKDEITMMLINGGANIEVIDNAGTNQFLKHTLSTYPANSFITLSTFPIDRTPLHIATLLTHSINTHYPINCSNRSNSAPYRREFRKRESGVHTDIFWGKCGGKNSRYIDPCNTTLATHPANAFN